MDVELIIILTFLTLWLLYMLSSQGAMGTLIMVSYLSVMLTIYFGSQYLWGDTGKKITLLIIGCYGLFAWKVKRIGPVILWPYNKDKKQ
jgi:hypothetical protein